MALVEPHRELGFNVGPDGANGGHAPCFLTTPAGIRTRYYDAGSPKAEPLVLCHGAGWSGTSSANTFARNLDGLIERGFHVLAADKLASGMTGHPALASGFTIQAQVQHMTEVIQAVLGPDQPFHILGQSRGGYLATRIALENGDRVRSLVVVDSATLAPDDGQYQQRRERLLGNEDTDLGGDSRSRTREHWTRMSFSPEHITDEFVEAAAYMDSLPGAQETARMWRDGGARTFNTSLAEQKEETLRWLAEGRLQKPILLYWGRNDPTAILSQGLALFDVIAEANPRTRMFIVNRGGHFHYREYVDEFNTNVAAFIRQWTAS